MPYEYTAHGHKITGMPDTGPVPDRVARCGGPGICLPCSTEAAAAAGSSDNQNDNSARRQKLRQTLIQLKCVQAGWAFGVPEDGRDQWLDEVIAAVM